MHHQEKGKRGDGGGNHGGRGETRLGWEYSYLFCGTTPSHFTVNSGRRPCQGIPLAEQTWSFVEVPDESSWMLARVVRYGRSPRRKHEPLAENLHQGGGAVPAASYVLNAIRWAESQLGSTAYRFRCLAFVEDCFEKGNSIEISGGSWANESAGMYGAGSGGEPDPGAFVFYGCFGTIDQTYRNWGHVGLCVGHGKVSHAWDTVRTDGYLEVESLAPAPGWTNARTAGGSPPGESSRGTRSVDRQLASQPITIKKRGLPHASKIVPPTTAGG